MKKSILEAAVLSILLGLTMALPANGGRTASGRDIAIEHAETCSEVTANLQGKIRKLQDEISKGGRIYTPAEIKKLETKLKETEDLLDSMMFRPGDKVTATAAEKDDTPADSK